LGELAKGKISLFGKLYTEILGMRSYILPRDGMESSN
jgi:hypothetical protein